MSHLRRFLQDETAATAVEYAVMLAMILLACLVGISLVGSEASGLWSDNEDGLQKAFSNVDP
jgi:pilus assembly protein Flp/PilA